MMPQQKEIDLPLLKVLADLGGKAKAQEVYEAIGKYFPLLTEADRAETLPSGAHRWVNRVQWARQGLLDRGELESAGWGTWAITDKGRQRLKLENQAPASGRAAVPDIGPECADLTEPAEAASGPLTSDLEELAEDYSKTFQRKILQNLLDRTPGEFERFASRLLTAYGFQKMTVTNEHTAPDGGIDGNGEYKVGLVSLRVAFQCKRWRGKVGRPEIDKFRGAISGQYEHGYFFTTSQFSPEARLASIKGGAVPIFLFDGDEIVRIMIDKELGITRRPVQIYEDRVDSLFEKE